MHTTEIDVRGLDDDASRVWTLHHNGDYSGLVCIGYEDSELEIGTKNLLIPFTVLLEFVGGALRNDKIEELEQTSGLTFLRGIE